MKINFIFLFGFLTILSGCHKSGHPAGMAGMTILSDLTDSFTEVQGLTCQQVISQLPENWNLSDKGVSAKFGYITDRVFNPVDEIKINPAEEGSEYNEMDRQNAIDTFYNRLKIKTGEIRNMPKGRSSSIVFTSLFSALNELVVRPNCTSRKLVLLGDCREHSGLFDAYSSVDSLKEHPENLKARIDKECPALKNLSGVSVILVHLPKSDAADHSFDLISKFLTSLLTERGAIVITQSNLKQ